MGLKDFVSLRLAWPGGAGVSIAGMNGGWEDAGTGIVRQESDQLRGLRENMDIAMLDRLRDTSINCEN